MDEPERVSQADSKETNAIAYCSICGDDLSNPEFALGYPNTVCQECNKEAVNEEGETPWYGSPPDQESTPGVADSGENPVFIDGIKCWRRYRFGGHIARRDAFDCDSISEFYSRHYREHDAIQIYNSPDPPGVDSNEDRLLVERYDRKADQPRVWGLISVSSGEMLASEAIAEQKFGPFDEFLDLVEDRAGSRASYKNALTDPATMLSFFYSFGIDRSFPRVQYLVPELDRPLSGLSAVPLAGAVRGLRTENVASSLFELEYRPVSNCDTIPEQSTPDQAQLGQFGTESQAAERGEAQTLTIRYRLPPGEAREAPHEIGFRSAQAIFQGIQSATSKTVFENFCTLPAVDIHLYGLQQELITIGVTAQSLRTNEWEELAGSPKEIRDHVDTYEYQNYRNPELPNEAEALVGVTLPSPRVESVAAVLAVRDYILDHNGSWRHNILRDLVPEENYPIGHNGPAAMTKGLKEGFREWWWDQIIDPGLQEFSDLESPDESEGYWKPVQ